MCGIIGQLRQKPINRKLFTQMRDCLSHRGPDGHGEEYFLDGKIALGHRRLSIIDLSEKGSQPMSDHSRTIWLTFNGEIYNFKSLKRELMTIGHHFESESDSEVLIIGYKEWGIQTLLSKIRGMFAFGIWDATKKQLIIVRDRFGMKPLYYYHDQNQFTFASEIKAITKDPTVKKRINQNSLSDFFIYGYIPNPNTIWDNCFKLPPAHYAIYDFETNELVKYKYWDLAIDNQITSREEAANKINELLNDSINEHMVSDVPVGLFLSGGYDSSSLLMHSKKLDYQLNTFSIGFENSARSEHQLAKKIAQHFNSNHHESVLTSEHNYLEDLKHLSYHYDEPFAVSSMLPYYYVSKLSAKKNKVVLVGDGGDELFGGYLWNNILWKRFSKPNPIQYLYDLFVPKHCTFIGLYNKSMTGITHLDSKLPFLNQSIRESIRSRGLWLFQQAKFDLADPLKASQELDFQTFIPEPCLTRADRSSMANSQEVRVPFLDHRLFEYTFSLDSSVYFDPTCKKVLLEQNLREKVPNEVFTVPKRGFSFQKLGALFQDEWQQLISEGELIENGILQKDKSLTDISVFAKFNILMLELWFRNFNS